MNLFSGIQDQFRFVIDIIKMGLNLQMILYFFKYLSIFIQNIPLNIIFCRIFWHKIRIFWHKIRIVLISHVFLLKIKYMLLVKFGRFSGFFDPYVTFLGFWHPNTTFIWRHQSSLALSWPVTYLGQYLASEGTCASWDPPLWGVP